MISNFYIVLSCILLLFLTNNSLGQELPPIQRFTPTDYDGENQNWMVSQSNKNYIYVANNKGLLECNGSQWHLYPSPNNTILRAVNAVGDKIYTACYMEFGYWLKNLAGKLEYHSLLPKLQEGIGENEQFWNIITYHEWVIFQSTHNLYFYDTLNEKFKVIKSEKVIFKIFIVQEDILYQVLGEGIYRIENGKPKLIIADAAIKDKRITNIFEQNDGFVFLTRESGFYKQQNNIISKWDIPTKGLIEKANVFCGLQLSDGNFIIGTISDGIINLKSDGTLNYHINQRNGLSNNTALALFEDNDRNLWVGLDNGINCINISSPIKVFYDYDGILGTVYVSMVFNGYLYLGTNQGLFYQKVGSKDAFTFVDGTGGQVWNLFNYNDEDLLCGHHLGTYLINKGKAQIIDSTPGTWIFKTIPGYDNLLLRGSYDGLSIMEKAGETWKVKNKIEGFNSSSRFVEYDKNDQIWVNHEYKGVYKIQLNDSLTKAAKVQLEPTLSIGKNSSLVKYMGDILYVYEKGIFKLCSDDNSFAYDSALSPMVLNQEFVSGKLVVDNKERLWAFGKENITYVTNDNLSNKPKINTISIRTSLKKGAIGFENISPIKDEVYLLGTTNGYITIDLPKTDQDRDYSVFLNAVGLKDINDNWIDYNIHELGEFRHRPGIITFDFSVPNFDQYLNVQFQHKLIGHQEKWSNWHDDPTVRYENLDFGDYTFYVRAKIGNKLSANLASYNFTVNRPWHLSNLAFVAYFIILLTIAWATNNVYKRYYHKKFLHKQLESEKLIMHIKNQQLNQDIENKNRELAISKMSIIKKNEFLNKIKNELKNKENSRQTSSVVRLIDKNLNNTKDWELFVEAFNNADKDFLDKMKSLHPDLTPSDLRLCVYLRMNLTSKEISPLLNISLKSVDTKRYRLRKRMNLLHEESLVSYILNV